MSMRGETTRARLIAATRTVVRDVGYAHASTRAIAQAAGVAEGTIYRHFPEKAALFLAAVLDANASVVAWLAGLPERAGSATVEANLVEVLDRLATLRDDILPLELAIATDPELAAQHRRVLATADGSLPAGPPAAIAAYLAAEQRLGRIRADVDPVTAAVVLLAALFGLTASSELAAGVPEGRDAGAAPRLATPAEPEQARRAAAVAIFVHGIAGATAPAGPVGRQPAGGRAGSPRGATTTRPAG